MNLQSMIVLFSIWLFKKNKVKICQLNRELTQVHAQIYAQVLLFYLSQNVDYCKMSNFWLMIYLIYFFSSKNVICITSATFE